MKLNVTQQVIGFNGNPLTKSEKDDSAVDLREILVTACLNPDPKEFTDGTSKYRIYKLLKRVSNEDEDEVEIKAEEIATLKKLVAAIYPVAVLGPVYDLLEDARSNKEPEKDSDD